MRECPSLSLFLGTLLLLGGCAAAARLEGNPNQQAMVGKTKEQVLACAGRPLQQTTDHDLTLLRYYREAPILEESFATSKASRPGMHRGCWAIVVLEDDRVSGVIYRFVPHTVDASQECEDIFDSCVQ